jgi:predicted anti-sigma-YlaC factor YlaD
MEHEQIAEQNVVARYLMGSLAPEEEELFEEHLLECVECRRQIEWEEDFQNSLHAVAAEEAARATVVRVGLLAWMARHRGGWLLAAAVLLLAALPIAWLLREQGRLHGQITRLEAAAQQPVQPVTTPPPTGRLWRRSCAPSATPKPGSPSRSSV